MAVGATLEEVVEEMLGVLVAVEEAAEEADGVHLPQPLRDQQEEADGVLLLEVLEEVLVEAGARQGVRGGEPLAEVDLHSGRVENGILRFHTHHPENQTLFKSFNGALMANLLRAGPGMGK